jgi:hypothetical protein
MKIVSGGNIQHGFLLKIKKSLPHLMFAADGLNVLDFKCLVSVTKLLLRCNTAELKVNGEIIYSQTIIQMNIEK